MKKWFPYLTVLTPFDIYPRYRNQSSHPAAVMHPSMDQTAFWLPRCTPWIFPMLTPHMALPMA